MSNRHRSITTGLPRRKGITYAEQLSEERATGKQHHGRRHANKRFSFL